MRFMGSSGFCEEAFACGQHWHWLGGSTAACSCGGLGGRLPGRVLRGFGLWLKSHISADSGSFDSGDIGCCVGYRDPAGCSGGGLGGQLPGGVLQGFRWVRGCQTLTPRTLACSSKSNRGSLSLQLLNPPVPLFPLAVMIVVVVLGWSIGDKGCFGSYMKLYDLILLSMILQLE